MRLFWEKDRIVERRRSRLENMNSLLWTGKSWMERKWHQEESGKTGILSVQGDGAKSDGGKGGMEGKAALYSDINKQARGH